ncbi:evolutionarily conserved signaling intermediate in Toll pathway, mitochondrial isoform X3 [Hippopotamus amphibius kiboko]|uniref:evolutionarily conserved signaling intermediate in Toll pathway, mitochondrial isoform X3 n=1 Tax=Hippopotamus amphibius kiboko TaxID=575201 RepID=UPI002598CB63|nr:evolutionarily conserved signaling intermediate in Toll pathway, mitochondrial isoform X3 [Hippopotamus amphibius kiboko]
MSWAQAILLARGLTRGWGGICSTALTGAPFSQVPPLAPRGLRCSAAAHNPDSSLVPRPPEPPRGPVKALAPHEELFRQAPDGERDKASFVQAVQNFTQYNVHKRGHVDFIYLALRKMREYGVERDLAVYNLLLDIFPKEVFRPRNVFHSIFLHYPRQQECGIAVLEQMENHGVMPNKETEFLLIQIFGRKSYPMLKFVRMKLWFTRFKNINPFPVPRDLPQDPVDLASLALRHMEPDLSARVTIYQMPLSKDSTDAVDPTEPHIVGIQSPDQQAALALHNPARPIFVEGPFSLWLRDKCVYYHILRADLLSPEERRRKALSSPYAWQVPMTRPRWPSGSRACRRPTQPWPRSRWSSACQGPPGSSWRPPQGWRNHPHPHPRARKKRKTISSNSSRARAEPEWSQEHRLWTGVKA